MQNRFKEFTLLTAKIRRLITRIKTEEMAKYNLKSSHVSCLYYLYTMQELTAKELCEICDEDKAAVSRSVEYLEKSGYIRTADSSHGKYKRSFVLTESGTHIAEYVNQRIDSILEDSDRGLSEQERDILYRGLLVISENLQEICDSYNN
ncbi:MAG: MarR family transcriptional regulator [Clostridia bacterium]|nr:MarR family transcriptional regulator [Clostridia bacterium]